jgi:hypothetical protein
LGGLNSYRAIIDGAPSGVPHQRSENPQETSNYSYSDSCRIESLCILGQVFCVGSQIYRIFLAYPVVAQARNMLISGDF